MDRCRSSGEDPIVILDDLFPHVLSSFRYAEFAHYLTAMPDVVVHTSGRSLFHTGDARCIEDVIAEYVDANPDHVGRVLPLDPARLPRARLYYMVFSHLVLDHIEAIEALGTPFVFTLYPGGGFAMNDPEGDARLARIFRSPSFRGVVTTQEVTRRYLLRKGFCRDDQIVAIYGGVVPPTLLLPPKPKRRFGAGKTALDLCFVANRYTPLGTDKGYDLFVDAAKALVARTDDICFHVVGRFDASIIDLEAAAAAFTFHGAQPSPFFRDFYREVDAIISPTRPGLLYAGAFDGFPTGCCVEAGLNGAAVLCTDALGLNRDYVDGLDLLVIPPDATAIADEVMALKQDAGRLRNLGDNARRRMLALFSSDVQMPPRLELITRFAKCPVPADLVN